MLDERSLRMFTKAHEKAQKVIEQIDWDAINIAAQRWHELSKHLPEIDNDGVEMMYMQPKCNCCCH